MAELRHRRSKPLVKPALPTGILLEDSLDKECDKKASIDFGTTSLSSTVVSEGSMKTFRKILTEEGAPNDIELLVIGRTGHGKSALVNSIIELGEEIAPEGSGPVICTKKSHSYVYPAINIKIIDMPGLQDIHEENDCIQEIRNKYHEVSLVLYCMSMAEHRHTNDDRVALQMLHEAFGPKFWERVVFVLTFANNEYCELRDDRDEDEVDLEPPSDDVEAWKELVKKRFIHRVELRSLSTQTFIRKSINLESQVQFVPAGYYLRDQICPNLLDREDWLHDLLQFCCNQIKIKHGFSKLRLSDKINLAFIIDNRGEAKVEDDGARKLSDETVTLKESFEGFGFCVFCFNSLSSQAIATLLQSFKDNVDHSQLSMFTLIFLSKGKTPQLYDANGEVVPFKNVLQFFPDKLANTPKLFYFDLGKVYYAETSSLELPSCPKKSLIVTIVHTRLVSPIIGHFMKELGNKCVQDCCNEISIECSRRKAVKCIWHDNIKSKLFISKPIDKKYEFLKRQVEICHSLWLPIRYQTIDELVRNKDEVMGIIHVAAAGVALTYLGVATGLGLLFAPITFGASLAVGAAVGAAAGASIVAGGLAIGDMSATLASRVLSNRRLKAAQEHICLDQQLSLQNNEVASRLMNSGSQLNVVASQMETTAAMAIISAAANRTALAGGLFVVTVPIDISSIAYQIYQSSKDKTETNKWFLGQAEELLKGTCYSIDVEECLAQIDKPEYGYKVCVPFKTISSIRNKIPSIKVRTIFSGPFVLPQGYTLVSSVYHIEIKSEQQPQAVTVDIEHCVNVSNQSIAERMCFAIATIDLEKKCYIFNPLKDGVFYIGENYGSIIQGNCLLCVLYQGSLQDTSMMYTALCSYTREYKNFWTTNIMIMKHLKAHFKYAESQIRSDLHRQSFAFKDNCQDDLLSLKLENLKSQRIVNGWRILPDNEIPDTITKNEIDIIELQPEKAWNLWGGIFPSIILHVYAAENAAESLSESIEVEGTNLELLISRQKE